MIEKFNNFKDSIYAINMKGREIFVWFNNLCYDNRAWIVPILEILLLTYLLILGYGKIPKSLEKKHPGSGLYPNLFRFAFSMVLCVAIYYMCK